MLLDGKVKMGLLFSYAVYSLYLNRIPLPYLYFSNSCHNPALNF